VSVLFEGYQACHDLALVNDLELVDHPSTNAITSQLNKQSQCYHCSCRKQMKSRLHQQQKQSSDEQQHSESFKSQDSKLNTSAMTNSSRYLMLDESKSPV
jgi:hypothetical protein